MIYLSIITFGHYNCIISRTYILILDDLSHVVVPSVLAELLTAISYRGVEHPMWISDVFGRDGSLLYPCGYYYLYPRCYFIATQIPPARYILWLKHIMCTLYVFTYVLVEGRLYRVVSLVLGISLKSVRHS